MTDDFIEVIVKDPDDIKDIELLLDAFQKKIGSRYFKDEMAILCMREGIAVYKKKYKVK